MNSGDRLKVSAQDTPSGLKVVLNDLTAHQSGSMTASAANGFAQVKFDPTGTSCTAIPYNFHPMYSTSSEQTRVIWAATPTTWRWLTRSGTSSSAAAPRRFPPPRSAWTARATRSTCPAGNSEGCGSGKQPTDGDDDFCFPGSEALRLHVTGCTDTNTGFDGASYQKIWPDGNRRLHPAPILFGPPRTGAGSMSITSGWVSRRISPTSKAGCDVLTGTGCTHIPVTDSGGPAAFYPFFSAFHANRPSGCCLGFGSNLPGSNTNFGRNAQYGPLLATNYLAFGGGGASIKLFTNFRRVFSRTPCRA